MAYRTPIVIEPDNFLAGPRARLVSRRFPARWTERSVDDP